MVLVLGVHALFALLLQFGNHMTSRGPQPPRTPTGTWIRLTPLLPPPPAVEDAPVDTATATAPPAAPREERESRPVPRTAISLPAPPAAPVEESTAPARVDWRAAAARIAESAAQEKRTSIGKPLEPMREPCKPRVSSFWGKPKEPMPEEPPSWQGMVQPNANVLTGASRHTIKGGFSIPLGKSKPRDDLFDDMLAGTTPRSSVPDPNICD